MLAAITMGPTVIWRRGPILAASAPDRDDSASMMTVTGSSETPASRALYPQTSWSTTGTRKSAPPIAPYTTNVTAFAAENCLERKIDSGSMGSLTLSSATINAANAATPMPRPIRTVGDVQPPLPDAAIRPYVRLARARLIVIAPALSILARGPGAMDSGTCRTVISTTAAATGKLMKNTSRHETALISQPPTNGPIAVATPPRPDQAPMALPRSSFLNDASRIARLPGVSSAPPTPCSARAAISSATLGARPAASDARANQTVPMANTLRRPLLSPRVPPR